MTTTIEKLEREIVELQALIEELDLATDTCQECQKIVESLHDCKICDRRNLCQPHLVEHYILRHSDSPRVEPLEGQIALKLMTETRMTLYATERLHVTNGGVFSNWLKSAWFFEARCKGLRRPVIMNWALKPGANPEEYVQERDKVLNTLNLRVHREFNGTNLVVLAYEENGDPELFDQLGDRPTKSPRRVFDPGDIDGDDVTSLSGIVINPESGAGKVSKRLRVYTLSAGGFHSPEPSHFGELKVHPELTLRYESYNSDAAGDGSGMVKESVAKRILELSGAPLRGDMIRIQLSAITAECGLKGMFDIIPDRLWLRADVDLVVDKESFNYDVRSRAFTVGKTNPITHKGNSRYFWGEPLMLFEAIASWISVHEMAEMAPVIADRLDRETTKRLLDEDLQELLIDSQAYGDWLVKENKDNVGQILAKRQNAAVLQKAYALSGFSPFASSNLMDLVTGQVADHVGSKVSKSRPMPGIVVSGERVWFLHYEYQLEKPPKKGFLKLLWHKSKTDQLIGVSMCKSDLEESLDMLDTIDKDDPVELIFMVDEAGDPFVLVLRLPLTVGGGVCMRIPKQEAKKLQKLGYHFYRKVGGYRYPDLHRIANGEPVMPYRLEAQPFEKTPLWSADPVELLETLLRLREQKGAIGQAANLTANLDYAGIFDPGKYKLNMSDGIIDPATNGTADSAPIIRALKVAVVEAIRAGRPMDPCVWGRIAPSIEDVYNELYPSPIEGQRVEIASVVKLKCNPSHDVAKAGMQNAKELLEFRLNRRLLLSNGPVKWLTQEFDAEIIELASKAAAKRNALWSEQRRKRRAITGEKSVPWSERLAALDRLTRQIREEETKVMQQGYEAASCLPGYQNGEFTAAWLQLQLGRQSRFARASIKGPNPVTSTAIAALPSEEYGAYYAGGYTPPTVIVRKTAAPSEDLEPGQVYRIERINGVFRLTDTSGAPVARLEREAGLFEGLDLTYCGPMPKVNTDGWQQAAGLIVFQATPSAAWKTPVHD